MFDRRPGDGEAVEGRGAAADLVQDDQRALAGLVEDRRGLDHLDHEGRAPARRDRRRRRRARTADRPRRYAAARAGTKLPICASTAISAFCRRNVDFPAMFGPVTSQMRPLPRRRRAATGRNRWRRTGRRHAPAPARPPDGGRRRWRKQGCRRPPAAHNRARPRGCQRRWRHRRAASASAASLIAALAAAMAAARPIEDFELQRQRAVGGAGDLGFQFAELGGGEAHLAGEGLAMDEGCIERRTHQLVAVLGR